MAVSSDDQHRPNAQQQNMSLSASEVGSHVFDEGQTVDAERRGSFTEPRPENMFSLRDFLFGN